MFKKFYSRAKVLWQILQGHFDPLNPYAFSRVLVRAVDTADLKIAKRQQ